MKNRFRPANISDAEHADVILLGVEYDMGATLKKGTSEAPDMIRAASMNMPTVTESGEVLDNLAIFDAGNIKPSGSCEEVYKKLKRQYSRRNNSMFDSFILTMGGDHSITAAILHSLADKVTGSLGVVYFDAHTDLSYRYNGSMFTHASPLRRGLEHENLDPQHVVLVGVRSFEKEPLQFIRDSSICCYTPAQISEAGCFDISRKILQQLEGLDNIYLSIDIDVLDPAFAPATGVPDAGGLSTRELLTILTGLWPLNIVGADIVEITPALDINEITSIAGYKIVREILGIVQKRKNMNLRINCK